MGTLKIQNMSFRYDGMTDELFADVNLAIDESWKLGLIGRNGRGKTTLLNILRGQLDYHGSIETNLTFNYFPAEVSNPNETTEQVLLAITQTDVSELWKIQIEMDQLGLSDAILSQPFNQLSPGEQTKALLAASFSQPAQFGLIDEPTNHLDSAGREVVANYLKQKTGFIVISHDRAFLNAIIDHVISIDQTQLQLFAGNCDTWQAAFDQKNQSEAQLKSKIEREVKTLKQSAEQTKSWATQAEKGKNKSAHQNQQVNLDKGFISHKASKVMKKAQNTLKRTEAGIEQKQQLLKNVETPQVLTLNYHPLSKTVVTVQDLQVIRGDRQLLNSALNFELKPGERLVLQGLNGSGKSTILHALQGETDLIDDGTVHWAHQVKISYVSQTFDNLSGSLQEYADQYHLELSDLLNMLRKLGFERQTFQVDLSQMSMGQQRKLAIARSLCEPANVYLWDEPLNYLDVITRQEIETLITESQPTMIVVDHDTTFTEAIGTKYLSI